MTATLRSGRRSQSHYPISTIYSQILTGQSIESIADYKRPLADLDEEVRWLQDQLEALREVKEIK